MNEHTLRLSRLIARTAAALAIAAGAAAPVTGALAQTTASGHVALQGTYIEVGVNKDGYFGIPQAELPAGYHWHSDAGRGLGFVADYRKTGWVGQYGGDYFTPGNPYEGFYVGWTTGSTVVKGNYGASSPVVQIPSTSLVNTSSGSTHSAVWTGVATNGSDQLKVVQTYSFKTGDLFFTANVQLINTGTTTLNSVKFVRQVDPDNDESWPGGSYTTANLVVSQPPNASNQALVTATGTKVTDMTLGLGAIDARAKVSAQATRGSPDSILLSPVSSVTNDVDIGLAFNVGTLAPGQSASFDYAYILSASDLNAALGSLAAVTIQQPTGTVSGAAVPFQVTTDDLEETSEVDFYVNGTLVGTSTTPVAGSFSTTFDSTAYPNGSLSLKAVAIIDETPVEKTSTVIVDNSGPPLSFTAPENGASVNGDDLAVAVDATDLLNQPTQVTFYREVSGKPTVTLGTITTAPFATTFDTSDLPAGTSVTLRAVGRNAGGQTTNVTVGVVTSALPPTSTSVALSSSLEPSTADDTVQITATLTPAAATGTVQFRVDGTNVGGPVAVSGGTAVASLHLTAAGAHAVAAVFTASGNYLGSSGSITQDVSAGAPASISVGVGASGQVAIVGGAPFASALAVTVQDAYGNPVPGASVLFLAPGSGASATLDLPATVTDAGGLASVIATPNAVAGPYAIEVWSGPAIASISLVNAPDVPAALLAGAGVSGQAAVAGGPAFAAALAVIAVDQFANPVPGVTLAYAAPLSGPSALLAPGVAVTDALGVAAVVAHPGTVAGSYVVDVTSGALEVPIGLTNLPAAPATVAADAGSTPQAATVGGTAFAQPLGALVRDAYGNPVPSATVSFAAPGAGATAALSATSAVTDAAGHAQITAQAGSVAGSYAVIASVPGGASATFRLANLAGSPAAIQVVSGDGQHASVEGAFAAPLVVAVVDAFGNPVPGSQVAFAVPASGASATLSAQTALADENGQASVGATPGTVAGPYAVTASAAGVSAPATFSLANDPGLPASVTVDPGASAQSAQVGAPFPAALSVTVTDQYANAVPGVPVAFSVPGSGATATLSAASDVTDAGGHAQVGATAATVTGSYFATASIADGPSAALSLTNTAGAPATLLAVSGDGQHATVASAFAGPLVVAVADAYGNAVPGSPVSFQAPASGASADLAATSVTTGPDGTASVAGVAGTVAGGFQVTAHATGAVAPAIFSLVDDPGAPASVTASPAAASQTAQVGTSFAATLAVTVRDAYGNAVPNVAVSYAVPSSGPGASLTSGAASTGPDGVASVSATANTVSGAYPVTASVEGVSTPAAFSLANQPGAPGSIAVTAGGAQSAVVDAAYASPLEVVVRDAYGNVVPEVTVTFSAPSSGATALLSAPAVSTGADGKASITATAGTVSGPFLVTAGADGVGAPAQLALTNLPGAPASLVASPSSSGQSARVGDPFAAPLALTVLDVHGNPVPGAAVAFACPADPVTCSLDQQDAVSDAAGRAAANATAGERPGSLTVAASVGSLPPVTYQLANLVGLPGTIAAVSSVAQSAPVYAAYAAPLAVVVKDRFGNVVPDAAVSFVVGSTGAQSVVLSAASATTDASGAAQVTATANSAKGAVSVSASAQGVAAPAVFTLTNNSIATQLAVDIGLPVYGTVIRQDGITRLDVAVGPSAGGGAPSGTVTLHASRAVRLVPGQAGVSQVGDAVIATLAGGKASVNVQVMGWRSRTLQADYTPDAAGALTFDPSTTTVGVRADAPEQSNGGGGCSTGGGGASTLLPLALLGLVFLRRRGRRGAARTAAVAALLAAAITPGVGAAQVDVGLRLGFGLAGGSAAKGSAMSDTLKSAVPVQLDVAYRLLPRLGLGGYGSWAPAQVGSICDGASCSGQVVRLGLQASWQFDRVLGVSPWAGGAAGYEWGGYRAKSGGDQLDVTSRGLELGLQGGADWRVLDQLSVGPFLAMSLGRYDQLDVKSPLGSSSGALPATAVHTWITVGVRGTFGFTHLFGATATAAVAEPGGPAP